MRSDVLFSEQGDGLICNPENRGKMMSDLSHSHVTPAAPALDRVGSQPEFFNNNYDAFWEPILVDRGASRVRTYLGSMKERRT
jgi:hypothetical protein